MPATPSPARRHRLSCAQLPSRRLDIPRRKRRNSLRQEPAQKGTFARVNKNTPNRQVVPRRDTPTKRDLLVLYDLINESQRHDGPLVEFRSRFAALQRFGLGDGAEQYDALRQTIARLKRLRFRGEWYRPVRNEERVYYPDNEDDVLAFAADQDVSPRGARRLMRRRNKLARYQTRSMRYLRGVRRCLDGRLVFAFEEKFFSANRDDRNFVRVYLADIRRLDTAPADRAVWPAQDLEVRDRTAVES